LKSPYKGYYVNIGSGWGLKTNNIWTIEIDGPTNNSKTTNIESEEKAVPLVLIHGLGCGTGIWSLNYDSFAGNRKVFAFDILGFGRSSRPTFSTNETVEAEIVESIERWRKGVGLNDKFILLGHSFGGYLSLAYALKHPDHVSRLILADPWGIPSPESGPSTHPRIILPGRFSSFYLVHYLFIIGDIRSQVGPNSL
jgi:pimeloyl-ACP methyl ester carboxylesterase